MTTHDEYATWDAAYVLGALAPAERREYEEHLRACERCSDAVGELAGTPGLLSRVPREQAFALLGSGDGARPADGALPAAVPAPEGPADTVLPSLLHRARRRRTRTRWLIGGLSAAAAAALVGVLAFLLPATLPQPPDEAGRVTMRQVEPSAVSADLRLTSEPWGTRIESRCQYAQVGDDAGYHSAWTYAMVVTDRAGHQTEISTWTAEEGTTAWPTATTSVPLADIATVDIRTAGDGTVLLRHTFD